MFWIILSAAAFLISFLVLLFALNTEESKRKKLETIVAKLRDKETLNEQEIEVYQKAERYDWLGNKIRKV